MNDAFTAYGFAINAVEMFEARDFRKVCLLYFNVWLYICLSSFANKNRLHSFLLLLVGNAHLNILFLCQKLNMQKLEYMQLECNRGRSNDLLEYLRSLEPDMVCISFSFCGIAQSFFWLS